MAVPNGKYFKGTANKAKQTDYFMDRTLLCIVPKYLFYKNKMF